MEIKKDEDVWRWNKIFINKPNILKIFIIGLNNDQINEWINTVHTRVYLSIL